MQSKRTGTDNATKPDSLLVSGRARRPMRKLLGPVARKIRNHTPNVIQRHQGIVGASLRAEHDQRGPLAAPYLPVASHSEANKSCRR